MGHIRGFTLGWLFLPMMWKIIDMFEAFMVLSEPRLMTRRRAGRINFPADAFGCFGPLTLNIRASFHPVKITVVIIC